MPAPVFRPPEFITYGHFTLHIRPAMRGRVIVQVADGRGTVFSATGEREAAVRAAARWCDQNFGFARLRPRPTKGRRKARHDRA